MLSSGPCHLSCWNARSDKPKARTQTRSREQLQVDGLGMSIWGFEVATSLTSKPHFIAIPALWSEKRLLILQVQIFCAKGLDKYHPQTSEGIDTSLFMGLEHGGRLAFSLCPAVMLLILATMYLSAYGIVMNTVNNANRYHFFHSQRHAIVVCQFWERGRQPKMVSCFPRSEYEI